MENFETWLLWNELQKIKLVLVNSETFFRKQATVSNMYHKLSLNKQYFCLLLFYYRSKIDDVMRQSLCNTRA